MKATNVLSLLHLIGHTKYFTVVDSQLASLSSPPVLPGTQVHLDLGWFPWTIIFSLPSLLTWTRSSDWAFLVRKLMVILRCTTTQQGHIVFGGCLCCSTVGTHADRLFLVLVGSENGQWQRCRTCIIWSFSKGYETNLQTFVCFATLITRSGNTADIFPQKIVLKIIFWEAVDSWRYFQHSESDSELQFHSMKSTIAVYKLAIFTLSCIRNSSGENILLTGSQLCS